LSCLNAVTKRCVSMCQKSEYYANLIVVVVQLWGMLLCLHCRMQALSYWLARLPVPAPFPSNCSSPKSNHSTLGQSSVHPWEKETKAQRSIGGEVEKNFVPRWMVLWQYKLVLIY
jgi:hypothetical protein